LIVNKPLILAVAGVAIIVLALIVFTEIPRPRPSYGPTVEMLTQEDSRVLFKVEVADTGENQSRGLMNRTSLPADGGMLFAFDGDDYRYFWMENTLIPLDMVFISGDGIIINIHENATPLSREVIRSGKPCRYVLEVNGGTCRAQGIEIGDKVQLSIAE
jgi:hypothetical protein